ncbi:hypothetical protein [Streptomyces jumonjinensis]|uniref:HTH cro/C1-type domain-containing protein n=1 Tax=Streptomyces jumonjinensis TaxID=1945 RepID=A0A646KM38_STRJU|nr:hypothetical protein [Streptomyces jumonjinensis]MQT03128.1 hypothetical protein [Streptomyces jumonjinensis]
MSQRPLPDHGTRACYLRGCRRTECSTAHYRYMKRRRLDALAGKPRRTPAVQTRAHAERLRAAGWSQAQIARAADIHHRIISAIIAGQPTVARHTALAILTISIGPPPADLRDTDPTGTIRRVRALVAIGWPLAQLAPQLGLHQSALGRLARGHHPMVRAATAERVAREYRRLARIPGPSTHARSIARRNGWLSPMAWDDIDDPDTQPETDMQSGPLNRNQQGAARREEIVHLVEFGISEGEIAARLGMAPAYVHDLIHSLRKAA